MLLASKYEEMYVPEVGDFAYITDNAFTKPQIREMEMLILRELNFELGRPLPLHFLRRASKAGSVRAAFPYFYKFISVVQLNPLTFLNFYWNLIFKGVNEAWVAEISQIFYLKLLVLVTPFLVCL